MTALWSRWVAFLSRREPATALALFRIIIASCILVILLDMMRLGLIDVLWLDNDHGGYRHLKPGGLLKWFGGATPRNIYGFLAVALTTTTAMLLGIGGPILSRVIAFTCLQSLLGLFDVNLHSGGSYDELIHNALWLLTLAPASHTLSVNAWRRTGRWVDDTPVMAWVRYAAVFQLVLMYWTTGLQKLSAYWTPGGDFSALYYILQQPSWYRTPWTVFAWQPLYLLTQIGTATAWFWEVLNPIWLVAFLVTLDGERRWARVRWAYLVIGLIFHVGIFLTLNVGPFSFVSMGFYVCLLHPREIDWIRTRLPGARGATMTE